MDPLKPVALKKANKKEREYRVLLGLVELYMRDPKPVGSNTLRDNGFQALSSATLRNYFASLEDQGFLQQQHSNGGRIPTDLAYQAYAESCLERASPEDTDKLRLKELQSKPESREIANFLQEAAELLSDLSHCGVFVSAPRFDHDFVTDLRLVAVDHQRCVAIIVTDFGLIQSHVLRTVERLSSFDVKRLEAYFRWRLTGQGEAPAELTKAEHELGHQFYSEVMVRYLAGYSNFVQEDLYRTGFSQLLAYPEFGDAVSLAKGLALFENPEALRALLTDGVASGKTRTWIGGELNEAQKVGDEYAVMVVPYRIHQTYVGSIGILGPMRLDYCRLYGLLEGLAETVSDQLTRSCHKFQIAYRQPEVGHSYLTNDEQMLLSEQEPILLEDKRNN